MKAQNKIVSFVGPSGVGKTSYAKRLIEKYNFVAPTAATTRQQRSDDDGHYKYVTESTFFKMVNSGAFLEWDRYSNYCYGTLLRSVEEIMSSSHRRGVILDLTPNGCRKVKEVIPHTIVIALLPDDPNWLLERLMSRNSQPPEEIQTRENLLMGYLDEINMLVNMLACKKVYASFSPGSWDGTFETIEKIVFES
ncbi:hypothetical protein HYT00_02580 [Candidatus Giovannonibacteria bacterium]|nr:hypothetical protein [Candidatus Giovannonibacteria bacterium]